MQCYYKIIFVSMMTVNIKNPDIRIFMWEARTSASIKVMTPNLHISHSTAEKQIN